MILLLGGTSETAALAAALATTGRRVLVSTATDEPLEIGGCDAIERRCGRLDEAGLANLLKEKSIRVVVDATHPYAAAVRAAAKSAADKCGVPYISFVRPATVTGNEENIHAADDHAQAARLAFSFGGPVLLTTGANNLAPYVEQSRHTGLPLAVRVLPREESRRSCREAGLDGANVIDAKGPFSVQENRDHIRRFRAQVLVTKDGGEPGGLRAKLTAAAAEHCRVVLVRRPPLPGDSCATTEEVLAQVKMRSPDGPAAAEMCLKVVARRA